MPDKTYYLNLRQKYLPEKINTIFLFESPPISGDYFYDPNGRITEQLFASMMKLIDCRPESKAEGLEDFSRQGYVLVDATYSPVNHIKNRRLRDKTILKDLPDLIADLKTLTAGQKVKIILVKANICRLLEKPLQTEGFDVVNNGVIVPFPGSGQQRNFSAAMKQLL